MGNWKYRRPRRFFYQKQYKDPASSYYDSDEPSPSLPAFSEDGVPSWEKKFCSLIGSVPWQKVVNAKNFMYCHGLVVNWNDSAAEEAFQSAKKRFWAEINGTTCECPLPNPDMYIDEIDWNPSIDPELIENLEQAFFTPEEEEKDINLECKNKRTRNLVLLPSEWNNNPGEVGTPWDHNNDESLGWNQWPDRTTISGNLNDNDNPWESCFPLGNEVIKRNTWGKWSTTDKLQGWSQRGKNVNQLQDWKNCTLNNDDNPWEQSFFQKNESAKDSAWEDSNNDMGNQQKDWNSSGNPWKRGSQGAGHGKAWGKNCGNNQWATEKMHNGGNQWESNFTWGSESPIGKQWRQNGRSGIRWRQGDDPYREPKDLEFRQPNGGWGTWTEGHRKREGRYQYVKGNKHVRFGENNYQAGHCWRGGTTKKRVSFPFE